LTCFYVRFNSKIYSISYGFDGQNLLSSVKNVLSLAGSLSKKFVSKLYLVGLRFRVDKIFRKSLVLKVNFSHKVKWYCESIFFKKFRKIKNAFYFKTRDSFFHLNFFQTLRRFRFPDVYKGNGIRLYKEKLIFKKRKQFST